MFSQSLIQFVSSLNSTGHPYIEDIGLISWSGSTRFMRVSMSFLTLPEAEASGIPKKVATRALFFEGLPTAHYTVSHSRDSAYIYA